MKNIKRILRNSAVKNIYYPLIWKYKLCRNVKKVRKKDVIIIAFVTMNIAMWKYDSLYKLLQKNKRFKLYAVISPSVKYSHEEMCRHAQQMRDYFNANDIEYIDWDIEHGLAPIDIRKQINPDILFYTQPGLKAFTHVHSFQCFKDKLLCYTPYSFLTLNNYHFYNRPFLNRAWKIFYATKCQCELAIKYSMNRGMNAVYSGYSDYDRFISDNKRDNWKIKDRKIKRIIWAPHFTISGSMIKGLSSRSNFIEMADFMLDVAKQYSDRIQIAFKPHPRLLTELYNHPKWGVEKADSYYKKWADLTNGQLEMGDFVSLFYYSDAMIHDSGSFVIDYIYFNKPQLFITKDVNIQLRESDRIAERVFQNVSTGYNENEIIDFIDNVVIRGNDTKSMIRKQILEEELLPPNGKFASENMYSDICASLGIDG